MKRAGQMRNELLSIVITNYNYETYLGDAISSALAVDWPRVEIIVVDDGSTDGSREVIDRFVPRGIRPLFLRNGGQANAAVHGFRRSRGDWIIFLDADDMLDPSLIREAIKVMRPGWSMIQFQMKTIDALGRSLNRIFPRYRSKTTPESIRRWAAQTGAYPGPPTSGNVLSRRFLDQIFPFEEEMDYAVDSYFVAAAPFLGDVLTVEKPLVSYRVHGKNDAAQSTLDASKLVRDLGRHIVRTRYAARIASEHGFDMAPDCWRYGFYNLGLRIASLRLDPAHHPIPDDTRMKCIRDAAVSLCKPQGFSPRYRTALAAWILGIALGPAPAAKTLVSWRYAVGSRPELVQRLIAAG